jgi:hypothetical protein
VKLVTSHTEDKTVLSGPPEVLVSIDPGVEIGAGILAVIPFVIGVQIIVPMQPGIGMDVQMAP